MTGRSAREVIEDHLRLAREAEVEEDLERNYAEDVLVLIRDGVHRGHAGARRLADRLAEELPGGSFEYTTVLVEGEIGLLEWTGTGGDVTVRDGVDTFVVRDGRIVAQTIHYTLERPGGGPPTS